MAADGITLDSVRRGGKRAMAAALAAVDASAGEAGVCRLLDEAYENPLGQAIGLTGPPGVGKSTLINELIKHWRGEGRTVGVIAIDPSSRLTGGALLGDRVRMRTDPDDEGVFIRSLAARGRLGGLADVAFASAILMRAVYNRVIIETVGVGQSEADIATAADTVILCIQPGSGDSMQFMKAGIMEIPHIAAVTKADAGPAASRALAELKGALSLASALDPDWETRCLLVSAVTGMGVAALAGHAGDHARHLEARGGLAAKRRAQANAWLHAAIAAKFGHAGLAALGADLRLDAGQSPFGAGQKLQSQLRVSRV